MIEIWEPRWHDRTVLIACYKVKDGNNKVKFVKGKALKGKVFDVDGALIKSCPVDTNGTINCYAVPLKKIDSLLEGL